MIPTRMNPLGSPPYLRRLEHLDATGTQYIDTGIKPQEGFVADVDFSMETGGLLSCGARVGYANNAFGWFTNVSNSDLAFGSATTSVYDDMSSRRRWTMGADGKFYLDGVLKYTGTGTYTQTLNYWLFQLNSNGSGAGGGKGKIYYAAIHIGNTLVRELIPVLDKSGVRCMYDTVTQKLYYNAGTGDFGGA